MLLNQVKGQAYERTRAEGKSHNFPVALPEHLADQAEEALKRSARDKACASGSTWGDLIMV